MKHFEILYGKAHVVELPEGAFDPRITQPFGIYLTYNDRFGFNRIKLPPGTWQIVGRLSDVTEEQAALIVPIHRQSIIGDVYKDFVSDKWDAFDTLESLESAIRASGWYLENPHGKSLNQHCVTASEPGDLAELSREWRKAQSRVLCRERCLLLRRIEG